MKKLTFILFLLLSAFAFGQSNTGIHRGLIRFQGTLALGFSPAKLKSPEQRYYIYGDLEYLLNDHWGLDGASFANIGSSQRPILQGNNSKEDAYVHSILVGPVYHFLPENAFDFYAGLQPGFSLAQVYFSDSSAIVNGNQFSPTISPFLGVAYYGSFFHLFAQARWLNAIYEDQNYSRNLSDLRFCIGLGFNFN